MNVNNCNALYENCVHPNFVLPYSSLFPKVEVILDASFNELMNMGQLPNFEYTLNIAFPSIMSTQSDLNTWKFRLCFIRWKMMAQIQAIKHVVENLPKPIIVMRTGSKSVLQKLMYFNFCSKNSYLLIEIIPCLNERPKWNQYFTFLWTRSHSNIRGNERVDYQTEEAASSQNMIEGFKISKQEYFKKFSESLGKFSEMKKRLKNINTFWIMNHLNYHGSRKQ